MDSRWKNQSFGFHHSWVFSIKNIASFLKQYFLVLESIWCHTIQNQQKKDAVRDFWYLDMIWLVMDSVKVCMKQNHHKQLIQWKKTKRYLEKICFKMILSFSVILDHVLVWLMIETGSLPRPQVGLQFSIQLSFLKHLKNQVTNSVMLQIMARKQISY